MSGSNQTHGSRIQSSVQLNWDSAGEIPKHSLEEVRTMRTRNIFTKLSFAIALVALAASGAVWEVRRVHAVQPPEPDRTVGMVGITRGQTIRLSLVNLAFVVD